MPRMIGTVVATAPHRNRPTPWVLRPAMKFGPAEMPTMAMKMFRPTEFINQIVGDGMRPKEGRTDRNHPPTRPAMSAPPAVERVSGTPLTFGTIAAIRGPLVLKAGI